MDAPIEETANKTFGELHFLAGNHRHDRGEELIFQWRQRVAAIIPESERTTPVPLEEDTGATAAAAMCAKLGALHADYLGSDQAQADFTNIITKQRKLVRNVAFTEVKVGAAIGDTHARVSGALVTFHRLQL